MMLGSIDENALRVAVAAIGVMLTIGFFRKGWRAACAGTTAGRLWR